MIILYLITQVFLPKINLQKTLFRSKNELSSVIFPNIKSNSIKYNIKQLLNAHSPLDLISYALNDPIKFYDDFADIFKYQILKYSMDQISNEDYNYLKKFISEDNFKELDHIFEFNSSDQFKNQLNQLSETYLKILIYEEIQFEGKFQGQEQLKEALRNFQYRFNKVKNKFKYDETMTECSSLKNLGDFKNDLPDFFDNTKQYKLAEKIHLNHKYSQEIDNIISQWYYKEISGKTFPLKTDSRNLVQDTDSIWKLIEKSLKITRMDYKASFKNETKCLMENEVLNYDLIEYNPIDQYFPFEQRIDTIKFISRVAEDKTYEDILNKLSRKSNERIESNIPQFFKLIKDSKRLSIVFENEFHLIIFIDSLKDLFGSKFENTIEQKEDCLKVRIKELKNGFKGLEQQSDEQKDLKVIFDVKNTISQIGFNIELQCHLENEIRWKKADHILYKFTRAADDLRTVTNTRNNNDRANIQKQVLNFMIIISNIFLLSIISWTVMHMWQSQPAIKCYNGDRNYCYTYCQNKPVLQNACIQWWENYHLDLDKLQVSTFCDKHILVRRVAEVCQDNFEMDKNFHFADGSPTDLICQQSVPNQINCIGKSNLVDAYTRKHFLTVSSQIKYMNINDENLLFIDSDNNLVLSELSHRIFQEEAELIKIKEIGIRHALISSERICIQSTHFNLYCSGQDIKADQLQGGENFNCYIDPVKQGLHCWGEDTQGQATPPRHSDKDVAAVALGDKHACTIINRQLHCWGDNNAGQANYHYLRRKSVTQVYIGGSHTCVLKATQQAVCQGLDNQQQSTIPETQLKMKTRTMALGQQHSCMIGDISLVCWGDNQQAQSEVPPLLSGWPLDLTAGFRHSCAIQGGTANFLVCWGSDEYHQLQIPRRSNLKLVRSKYFHTCGIQVGNEVRCWGLDEHGQASLPADLDSLITVATGYMHSCGVAETGTLLCWGLKGIGVYSGQTDVPEGLNYGTILKRRKIDQFAMYDTDVCQQKVNKGKIFCILDTKNMEINTNQAAVGKMCMLRHKICQVPIFKGIDDSIKCVSYTKENNITYLANNHIIDMTCGEHHLCVLMEGNTARCQSDMNILGEMDLGYDMLHDVMKIKAGKNVTCVLKKQLVIICSGKRIYNNNWTVNQDLSFTNLSEIIQ